MDDTISYQGLITSLLLPWLLGAVWVRALLVNSGRYNVFIVAGQGYFAGIFATTILVRLSDWSGVGLQFWVLAATQAMLGVLGAVMQLRQPKPANRAVNSVVMPIWHKAVVALLLALLAWRYLTLLQELMLRPLYAWDAWMNWVPKAIVWFQLEQLVEFVKPELWSSLGTAVDSYTLGNSQASRYPPGIPLILLWSMMGAGTWDHSYLFLPWILAAINLGLALYGYLRIQGCSVLLATLACYLLLSMPFLNVHTVLAGYADLWLAAAFSLGVFALSEWHLNRSWSSAALALLMALFCSQLKAPGIVFTVIIVAVLLRSLSNLNYKVEMLAALMLAVLVAAIFWFGIDVEIPGLGRLLIQSDRIEIPRLISYAITPHDVSGRFLKSMFLMINWNLIWYLAVTAALIAMLRGNLTKRMASDTLAIVAALTFTVLVFSLREDYRDITIVTTINRVLIYSIPALVFNLMRRIKEREHGQLAV
jgi:hypothetical protein